MEKPFIFPYDNSLDMSKCPTILADDSTYYHNGLRVPRVTHILASMLHDDYLIPWANAMGLYKHLKYDEIMDKATGIGSIVHNGIEDYLQNGKELDFSTVPEEYKSGVYNAWSAFRSWWSTIEKHDYKILMEEQTITCQYYGGTLDLLIQIDGKIYLLDFKTSNHLSYKYFLQLAAYRRALFYEMNINIDGCILLQLSKRSKTYNEVMLFMNDPMDAEYMRRCDSMFMTLVYGYHQRQAIEDQASVIIKR